MIAFEVMHYLKRKVNGKESRMALKLNMSKAYDRVEWNYLEVVLLEMGFNQVVVQLFMSCITSVNWKKF